MLINPLIKMNEYQDLNIPNIPSNYNEIWAPITSLIIEDIMVPYRYYVSTHGRVYSFSRRPGFLAPVETANGYMRVNLRNVDNSARYHLIHRIVLATFYYVPNFKELDANHIDGNKKNNFLYNLEWRTPKENIRHAIDTGLINNFGENNNFASITNDQAELIGLLLSTTNYTCKEIANIVNCSESIVYNIINGGSWKHIHEKYNIKLRNPRVLTDDQVHEVCKYFQDNKIGYGQRESSFRNICNIIGIEYNEASNRAIERIYYKITHKDICAQYDY